jgi:hypothetical protein
MVMQQQHENGMNGSSVVAMGNGGGGQHQQKVMRDNLHYAADSVSNAMSSLVRELNTGADFFRDSIISPRTKLFFVLSFSVFYDGKPVGISSYFSVAF